MRKPSRVRHWRQKFDVNDDLVFLKRMDLGDHGQVLPGDPLTEEFKTKMGALRLQVWWNGRFIGQRSYYEGLDTGSPVVVNKGRGRYEVTMPDGTIQKVHGKKALDALLQT